MEVCALSVIRLVLKQISNVFAFKKELLWSLYYLNKNKQTNKDNCKHVLRLVTCVKDLNMTLNDTLTQSILTITQKTSVGFNPNHLFTRRATNSHTVMYKDFLKSLERPRWDSNPRHLSEMTNALARPLCHPATIG